MIISLRNVMPPTPYEIKSIFSRKTMVQCPACHKKKEKRNISAPKKYIKGISTPFERSFMMISMDSAARANKNKIPSKLLKT